ncbi:hypothetical protein HBI25_208670 [Parastagonospora nodorum]|nr:hypothetical protein HBH52_211850 [Parastagonospora nodorum]KAH3996083.1 hypothetical protein HBI10_162060 [Parastagonospora nodorum]KAH4019564.1 hypothetical protein HBI13_126420 [Parastagonospora nodorum]KAH4019677.1 hypothetical protein HBI09_184280 [Parastagonospora nodorum]KAH4043965.1 hypothetical protein HBH49_223570 [Parastagonospora nodorum]
MGTGPIGYALVLIPKAFGATRVIGSEPSATRRRQVDDFRVLSRRHRSHGRVDHVIQQVTYGQGVDVVFDCAGAPSAVESGVNALCFQGTYVIITAFEKPVVLPAAAIFGTELVVEGPVTFADGGMKEAIKTMIEDAHLTEWAHLMSTVVRRHWTMHMPRNASRPLAGIRKDDHGTHLAARPG